MFFNSFYLYLIKIIVFITLHYIILFCFIHSIFIELTEGENFVFK